MLFKIKDGNKEKVKDFPSSKTCRSTFTENPGGDGLHFEEAMRKAAKFKEYLSKGRGEAEIFVEKDRDGKRTITVWV